ncbi:MAG: hypothetical protein K2I81_01370 [Alphaproteobacteria bacterium]|nr:hypothetical protein [Alphaproteobacteria bacterium]
MKNILIFATYALISAGGAHGAVRDGNATIRQTSTATPQRATTTEKSTTARTAVLPGRTSVTSRTVATPQKSTAQTVTGRTAATTTATPRATQAATSRSATNVSARAASTPVVARAAATTATMSTTRVGAEYEQCKNAFFTCMDQFCTLKNDDYRRCSCSNRVYDLTETRKVLQDAGEQLTVFTENLNVVGMTAAQAAAMKTASEGENALTSDTSASKALLQAIMNSIRGTDSNVGGKYSDLNSINISFDTTNAFGMSDAGQAIAAYNGQNLYTAVYPQCRNAVKADCNDASLQRAVTAYLMAIEQDCNTVETAISEKQKQMKSAVREGSAMLDLARVENRQKHNSDNIATCLANVESAILSEEVCGADYHRCLDNGEFIDISTGAPIAGVANFYELENLLKFPSGIDAADQQLTKVYSNRVFVQNFEKRVKKFAQPALDKCTEQADTVWSEYLDKAMLDIFYAQKAKVAEIRQGCFDFVSACYMNGDTSITAAMKELIGDSSVIVQPHRIVLNDKLCTDYVNSCNNMFDNDIVKEYIQKRTDTDTLTACRAVVKQCFDKYGGSRYENFYYPYSGLFKDKNSAPDWFTLYEIDENGPLTVTYTADDGTKVTKQASYKSECAKQLTTIDACSSQEMVELAFGGFDKMKGMSKIDTKAGQIWFNKDSDTSSQIYGLLTPQTTDTDTDKHQYNIIKHRNLRPTGVATETYNQIIDTLTTQCSNLQGRFVEYQFIRPGVYETNDFCKSKFSTGIYKALADSFRIADGEDMCPRDYNLNVQTQSWGACLCWENGGRRSKWGKSAKCVAEIPVDREAMDNTCDLEGSKINDQFTGTLTSSHPIDNWCLIPPSFRGDNLGLCIDINNCNLEHMPEGME